jgi:hypothetical protein
MQCGVLALVLFGMLKLKCCGASSLRDQHQAATRQLGVQPPYSLTFGFDFESQLANLREILATVLFMI